MEQVQQQMEVSDILERRQQQQETATTEQQQKVILKEMQCGEEKKRNQQRMKRSVEGQQGEKHNLLYVSCFLSSLLLLPQTLHSLLLSITLLPLLTLLLLMLLLSEAVGLLQGSVSCGSSSSCW